MRRGRLGVALDVALANEDGSVAEFNAAGHRLVDMLNVLHAPEGETLELVRRCSAVTVAAKNVARAKEKSGLAIIDLIEANHAKEKRQWQK